VSELQIGVAVRRPRGDVGFARICGRYLDDVEEHGVRFAVGQVLRREAHRALTAFWSSEIRVGDKGPTAGAKVIHVHAVSSLVRCDAGRFASTVQFGLEGDTLGSFRTRVGHGEEVGVGLTVRDTWQHGRTWVRFTVFGEAVEFNPRSAWWR
jgi:hypothetical protein